MKLHDIESTSNMNPLMTTLCSLHILLALFFYALLAPAAYPWRPMAHRVAARFAEQRLTARTLAAVRGLLEPGLRIEDVSTWADEQREIAGSERWHYVNVPISAPRYDSKFCPASGCIVSKIEEFIGILQHPKAKISEKQIALKFLLHLIVDLHQPLHVGDNGDRGGNLLQVRFSSVGTNLHSVWDTKVMERYTDNQQVWLRDIASLATPENTAAWSKGTPRDWANESLSIAKSAYRLPGTQKLIKPGTKLSEDYYRFALPIIQLQLSKAGVRLAYVLNELFK